MVSSIHLTCVDNVSKESLQCHFKEFGEQSPYGKMDRVRKKCSEWDCVHVNEILKAPSIMVSEYTYTGKNSAAVEGLIAKFTFPVKVTSNTVPTVKALLELKNDSAYELVSDAMEVVSNFLEECMDKHVMITIW